MNEQKIKGTYKLHKAGQTSAAIIIPKTIRDQIDAIPGDLIEIEFNKVFKKGDTQKSDNPTI